LLKLRSLAHVRLLAASAAQARSFVDVLPTDPVMPMTGPSNDARWAVASAISARNVSGTSMAVPGPTKGCELRQATAPRPNADSMN